ncbi:peptidoglycan glycosyltransferase FtsW [Devriesea agamarum]|uniref:peptidoglycan glycosyltransferase FtsW n=1 Tax=Devriesea agamarum TaxID=472569 RepID=UPI000AD654C8|nr:putative peptidoglycan glycosyltransferase FtsW [Devriesea agamarum]
MAVLNPRRRAAARQKRAVAASRASGSPRELKPVADPPTPQHRSPVTAWLSSPALDFYALIVLGILLVGFGLMMVLSSTAISNIAVDRSGYAGLLQQGRFAILGIVAAVVAALVPIRVFKRYAWPFMVFAILFQLLVFVPGLGWAVGGNRNWIRIAGFTAQPSELLKLALALWMGAVLAIKRPLLREFRHLLIPAVPMFGLVLLLVALGHDLGTTLVLACLVAGSLWVAGVPRRVFAAFGAVGLIGVIGLTVTSKNRMGRILAWLTGDCPDDLCMQPVHGLQALAEGGWWGVGLGASRQKWGRLPAAANDYIFAIIGEELGLFGTLTVILLFVALALVLARMVVRHHGNPFVQITIAGVSAWLFGQALMNMCVVVGLLPVIGVPLPFISAGGSALVVSLMALGVMISFARHEPGAQEAISASFGRVRRSVAVLPVRRRGASRPSRSARKSSRKAGS